MKPVLLLAYHYPPSTAVGGVRPSKFGRYLPDFGWRPWIVAAKVAASRPDPAEQVVRVREWPHPLKTYERWRERASVSGASTSRAAQIEVPYDQCFVPRRGLKRGIVAAFSLPDQELGWLPPAFVAARRLIRRHGIRHLISTGPPFTAHVLALALKRVTQCAWIADFLDPWSLAHKFPIFRTRWTDTLESRLIGAVVRHADLILSVTPAMTDELRKEHRAVSVERFQTLTSGFDPEEFAALPWTPPASRPIVFSYVGTFYHGRTPEPFLRALGAVVRQGLLRADDIRVRFVGHVARADGKPVLTLVRQHGLDGIVSLHTPVSRREALLETVRSHVALVLDERHPLQIPLKLYDALAAGPIIFNIGSRGAVADVLMKTGRGIAVDHGDVEGIAAGILSCVARVDTNQQVTRPWDNPDIQEFDFRRLTKRLSDYLNRW